MHLNHNQVGARPYTTHVDQKSNSTGWYLMFMQDAVIKTGQDAVYRMANPAPAEDTESGPAEYSPPPTGAEDTESGPAEYSPPPTAAQETESGPAAYYPDKYDNVKFGSY